MIATSESGVAMARANERFTIPRAGFTPAYAKLGVGELRRRAAEGLERLRECRVNRLEERPGVCRCGRRAIVSSFFPHAGEEDCLRGWRGSGTIFFSMCNLWSPGRSPP